MTLFILAITVIASLLAFSNETLQRKWMFNPYMVQHRNEWWRFITSGLIHADFMHLFVNAFVLFSFGQVVEQYYDYIFIDKGSFYFVLLYVGGMIIAHAPSFAKYKNVPTYNSLGASGAVAAIMFAAILFQPWAKIYLFGIIGVPGILLGPLYLFFEYRSGQQGRSRINHDAHFCGAIFGLLFTIALKPSILVAFIQTLMQGPSM